MSNPLHRATCGHPDIMGYFARTVCHKCAAENHRRAMNNQQPKPRKNKK